MKKVFVITLTFILILSFVGCKKDTANKEYDSSNPESSSAFTESDPLKENNKSKDDDANSNSSSNATSGNKTSSSNGIQNNSKNNYSSDVKEQNEHAKEVLIKVLEKEQTFTAKTSVVSDKTTEQTLEKYHFQTIDNAYYSFVPEQYAFVDMDIDNIDELVIFDVKMNYYLVLRYENGKVYGYNIGARSLIHLKTDGSFMTSSAAGINSIGNIRFDGSECKVIDKALANDYDQEYFIDGKKQTKKLLKSILMIGLKTHLTLIGLK